MKSHHTICTHIYTPVHAYMSVTCTLSIHVLLCMWGDETIIITAGSSIICSRPKSSELYFGRGGVVLTAAAMVHAHVSFNVRAIM